MSQDWLGVQQGNMKPALQEQIAQLGLDYRLMTQFTSFVAVEEKIVTKGGRPQRIEVPVEMPNGVSYEGVFGEQKDYDNFMAGQAGGVLGRGRGNLAYPQPSTAATQTVEVHTGSPQLSTIPQSGVHGQLPAPLPPPPPAGGPIAKLPTKTGSVADAPSADLRTKGRRSLEGKLHPAVLAALDCYHKAGNTSAYCANVHAGKIALEIWLTADSTTTREQLRVLGFELSKDHPSQKMVAGNLAIDKLEALAKLDVVQFVSLERR
jgi:Ca-activated chloride channel family protein